jgi:hypothetical protein
MNEILKQGARSVRARWRRMGAFIALGIPLWGLVVVLAIAMIGAAVVDTASDAEQSLQPAPAAAGDVSGDVDAAAQQQGFTQSGSSLDQTAEEVGWIRLLGPWIVALMVLVMAATTVQTILAVGTVMAIESDESAWTILRGAARRSVRYAAQAAVITLPPMVVLVALIAWIVHALGASALLIVAAVVALVVLPIVLIATVVLALATVDCALAAEPQWLPATAWRVFRADKSISLRMGSLLGACSWILNMATTPLPDGLEFAVWIAGAIILFAGSLAAWHALYRKHVPLPAPPVSASQPALAGAHAASVPAPVPVPAPAPDEDPRTLHAAVAAGQPAAKWMYCDTAGDVAVNVILDPPRRVTVRCCPQDGSWMELGDPSAHSQQLTAQLPAGWLYVQVDSHDAEPTTVYVTMAAAPRLAS